jgi:hypothetical protein
MNREYSVKSAEVTSIYGFMLTSFSIPVRQDRDAKNSMLTLKINSTNIIMA